MRINKFKIIKAVLFLIILLCIGVVLQRTLNRDVLEHEHPLDSGWNITIGDKTYHDVTASTFHLPTLKKGDTVTMMRQLERSGYRQTSLRVQTRYSSVQIFLDGREIYEDGSNYREKNMLLGNGYHWLALPDNYPGSQLRIVYHLGENKAITSLDQILIMDSMWVCASLVTHNLITAVITCCLVVIGLICILYTVIVGIKNCRFKMLFWLGAFAIFVGMWMACNSRLVQIIYENIYVICYVEYLSMYASGTSMLFFVSAFFNGKRKKKFFNRLIALSLVLNGILIICNVTNIVHFPKTVIIFQLFALVSAIIIMYMLAVEVGKQQKAERIFLIGIVCFFVCIIIELGRYRYNKMCIPAHALTQSFIPIGAMVFILAMSGSFFFRIIERVAEDLERKTLYDMAFQDALTNIKNRAWCEKVMAEYKDAARPCTIVNMDLNLFKQVNDTFGHAIGDELLIRFAKILASVFREEDCVGRMGGDEFVVISDYMPQEVIEEHIKKLLEKIKEENANHGHPYEISVSYGYASDAEGKGNPWRIYEKADKKMYQYKKKAKRENRNIGK